MTAWDRDEPENLSHLATARRKPNWHIKHVFHNWIVRKMLDTIITTQRNLFDAYVGNYIHNRFYEIVDEGW